MAAVRQMRWLLAGIALALAHEASAQGPAPSPGPSSAVPAVPENLNNRIVPTLLQPTHLVTVNSEQRYVVMTNVTFATAALLPNSQQPLYVRNLFAVNATVCSNACRRAKNAAWAYGGRNVTVNCTLWRYCMDPNGCPSSSPQYNSLGHRICQLQSYYNLDLGFAQGPYQALGNMAVPVPNSLYGAPIQLQYRDNPVMHGYARYPCIDFVQMYDFISGCPANFNVTNPSLGINPGPYCWINGTLPEIAAACNGIAECDLFVYFPLGKSLSNQPGWPTSAFLKTARNPANISQLKFSTDILDPPGSDSYNSFNPLAVTYFKYGSLLEGSVLKPSALTPSQVIAVLEVRNLTGLPAAVGAQLGRVIKAELDPVPLATVLREAALSQSRIRLDSAGRPAKPPSGADPLAATVGEGTPAAAPAAPPAAAAAPGAAAPPAAAPPHHRFNYSGPLNSSLVVLNLTFNSPDDAAKSIQALNASDAGLLRALNRQLRPPASYLVLLYATGQQLLNISQAPAQAPTIAAPQSGGLSVPAQICIAVFATLAGVVAVVAGAWVFLSQRRRRAQPSGNVLFANGHEGKAMDAKNSAEAPNSGSGTAPNSTGGLQHGWSVSGSSNGGPDSGSHGMRHGISNTTSLAEGLGPPTHSRALLSNVDPNDIRLETREDGSLRVLGSGTYGKVYLGRWRWYGLVAVKQLIEADERREQAFVREAELLQALRHPNIVSFLGACLEPGRMLCVSEYLPNGNLEVAIRKDRERKDGKPRLLGWYMQGRPIAVDVARGLAFLHTHKILHMDIKSSNCLLTRTLTCKIADVGIAKAMSGNGVELTQARGSWAYMAPEVHDYRRPLVGSAADIYSYGVVLWEVITGERPDKLRGLRAPEVPLECPQEAAVLYQQCLSSEAAKRPTAMEIVDIITRLPKSASKGAPVVPPKPAA